MDSKYLIYALVDPRDLAWRYIGRSSSGLQRPRTHNCLHSLRSRTYKNHWIKSLKKRGLRYKIQVIEEFSGPENLSTAEVEWIAAARALGLPLTNVTAGGEGTTGSKHPLETRLLMSRVRGGLDETARGRVVEMYGAGMSTRAIGAVFGTGSKVVWRILRLAGVRTRTRKETIRARFRKEIS